MPQSLEHLLVDLANQTRLDEVDKGHGRFETAYATLASGVKFRCFTASASELALAQQLRMVCTHTGYVLPEVDVAISDVMVRTHREGNPITPEYYRVTGVLDPSLTHHRKLVLERHTLAKEA